MHFGLDDEKILWQPLNEQTKFIFSALHAVLIDWIIRLVLLQPFEVVELKTLRHDRLQSPSRRLVGPTHSRSL